MRVGIVGCGLIGGVHAGALETLRRSELADVEIVATYDAEAGRAETMARAQGAEAASSLAELVDVSDVVYVCTPTAAHAEAVEAAVGAARPVFCEKPLAPTLETCERVSSAMSRVPHQVGLVLRFAPMLERLAAVIADGTYGRVMSVLLRDDQFFPITGHYASDWRSDVALAGGGTLIEHSIHDIDVFRWLLGDPVSVTGHTANFAGHQGIEDLAGVTLSYADGRQAVLHSVWHQIPTRPSGRLIEVFFEHAVIWTGDPYGWRLHVQTASGRDIEVHRLGEWARHASYPEGLGAQFAVYVAQAKSFVESIAAGTPAFPDAEAAMAAHRIVDAAYRSAREHVPIDIG